MSWWAWLAVGVTALALALLGAVALVLVAGRSDDQAREDAHALRRHRRTPAPAGEGAAREQSIPACEVRPGQAIALRDDDVFWEVLETEVTVTLALGRRYTYRPDTPVRVLPPAPNLEDL